MFYCVETVFRAGGNISCHIYTVNSSEKPKDIEEENLYNVTIRKYFDDEYAAMRYARRYE